MSRAQKQPKQPKPPKERGPALQRWFWVSIPLGIAAGLATGLGIWNQQLDRERADIQQREQLVQSSRASDSGVPPPREELRALLAQDGLVKVDPSVSGQISQEQRAQAESLLEGSGKPLFLAFMRAPEYAHDGYTREGALATWADDVGEDGHYVMLWTGGRADSLSVGYANEYLWEEAEGQPGPALVRVAEAMTRFDFEEEPEPEPVETRDDRDYWGGAGGGVGAALLVIFFVVMSVYGVVFALMRRRAPRPERPAGKNGER